MLHNSIINLVFKSQFLMLQFHLSTSFSSFNLHESFIQDFTEDGFTSSFISAWSAFNVPLSETSLTFHWNFSPTLKFSLYFISISTIASLLYFHHCCSMIQIPKMMKMFIKNKLFLHFKYKKISKECAECWLSSWGREIRIYPCSAQSKALFVAKKRVRFFVFKNKPLESHAKTRSQIYFIFSAT